MSDSVVTSEEYFIEKLALSELLLAVGECGDVISFFSKPKLDLQLQVENGRLFDRFFASSAFKSLGAKLRIRAKGVTDFAMLNRLEFEASLLGVVLKGGCHGHKKVLSKEKARAIVEAGVAEVFPEPSPYTTVSIWRIDNKDWCDFTCEATTSSTYIATGGPRRIWWVLCVSDVD